MAILSISLSIDIFDWLEYGILIANQQFQA